MFAVEVSKLVKTYPLLSWLEHPGATYSYQWLVTLIKMAKSREKKRIVALDNVSFKVRKGEIFGIVGPNGAGKTTLFKCISGVLIPDSGKIFIEGIDAIREVIKTKEALREFIGGLLDGDGKIDKSSVAICALSETKRRIIEEVLKDYLSSPNTIRLYLKLNKLRELEPVCYIKHRNNKLKQLLAKKEDRDSECIKLLMNQLVTITIQFIEQ